MGTEPKQMPRTAPDARNKAAASIIAKAPAKQMSRSAKGANLPSGKETSPIELKHTNWRHKTKDDPKEVEYKKMMSGMGFANL